MEAKDLMLGDWVCYRIGKDKVSMPMQVCLISESEVYLTFEDNEADPWIVAEDELIPIPLSVEILERNGFECSLYNNAADGLGYRWIIYAGVPLFLVPSGKSWAVYAEGSDCPLTMILMSSSHQQFPRRSQKRIPQKRRQRKPFRKGSLKLCRRLRRLRSCRRRTLRLLPPQRPPASEHPRSRWIRCRSGSF